MHIRDYTDPISDLIDAEFDLEPLPGKLQSHGWRDRKTGLEFERYILRPEDWRGPDREFMLWVKHGDLPKVALTTTRFTQIGPITGPPYALKYRVSRADILRNLNRPGPNASALRQIVDRLGGDDAFVDLCLKGARACHRVYGVLSETEAGLRDLANFVEFEVVA